ncbi:MAG: exosortase H [Planctomycetes bacterium]|nr:exosortase H [Planctomycetota bacterium]MBI3847369.1 exosortase H [Planctomycetota bacterium]
MPSTESGRIGTRSAPLRFCLRFGGIVIVLFALLFVPALEDAVVEPFMSATAASAACVLEVLGEAVVRNGLTLVPSSGSAITIAHGCDVTYEWILFVAAIVAFPASWRSRGLGLLVGLPAIFLLNLVRVVTLFYLASRESSAFEFIHVYVWQTFFIAFVFGVWALWARTTFRPPTGDLAAEAR